MMFLALSIALIGTGLPNETDPSTATPVSLPEAPTTQVLDRMEWLNEDRREALESELSRLREEHDVHLYVVVWDRRLPDGQRAEDLATELGEWWSEGELWGTVLLTPEAINRPIAMTGGKNLDDEDREHLAAAASYSVDFGSRAWTDQGRLEQTALTLAEELIFARQKLILEQQEPKGTAAVIATLKSKDTATFPVLLAAVGTVLLFTLIFLVKRLRSKPNETVPDPEPSTYVFPTPQHAPRLDAPWSGGCSLVTNVPAPPTN